MNLLCLGTVYEGEWVRGVREGHGKITFKDGSYYRGDMQKNQMWGHGVFVGGYCSSVCTIYSATTALSGVVLTILYYAVLYCTLW